MLQVQFRHHNIISTGYLFNSVIKLLDFFLLKISFKWEKGTVKLKKGLGFVFVFKFDLLIFIFMFLKKFLMLT